MRPLEAANDGTNRFAIMTRRAALLVLLVVATPLHGQSPKGIPMSTYVDQIRTQFQDMNETAPGKPSSMGIQELHLEVEVIPEVEADGTLGFYVVEAGTVGPDVITQKLSFDVHLGADPVRPDPPHRSQDRNPEPPSEGGLRPEFLNKVEFMTSWATETEEGRQALAQGISDYLRDNFGLTLRQLTDALPKGVPIPVDRRQDRSNPDR